MLAAWIDHESLQIAVRQRCARLSERRWCCESLVTSYDVVEHGLVLDHPDEFRRV